MFSSDGVPLRATCTVKLKEADTAVDQGRRVADRTTPAAAPAAPAARRQA